jgi:hypothetical protein
MIYKFLICFNFRHEFYLMSKELKINGEDGSPPSRGSHQSPGNAFDYDEEYDVEMTGFGGTGRQSVTVSTGSGAGGGERNLSNTKTLAHDTGRKIGGGSLKNINRKSHSLSPSSSSNNNKNQRHQLSNSYQTVLVPVSRGGEEGSNLGESSVATSLLATSCVSSITLLWISAVFLV